MKIGQLDHAPVASAATGERKSAAAAGAAAPAAGAAEPSTRVELSSAAALLAQPADDGSFDQAKVDRIAQAIRDGSFKVDAEAIADKLIANAQELLGGAARR